MDLPQPLPQPQPLLQILKEKTPFDEEPLYMYLSHQAVHDPLGIPPDEVFSDDELSLLDNIQADSDENGQLRTRFAKACNSLTLLLFIGPREKYFACVLLLGLLCTRVGFGSIAQQPALAREESSRFRSSKTHVGRTLGRPDILVGVSSLLQQRPHLSWILTFWRDGRERGHGLSLTFSLLRFFLALGF